MAYKVFGNVAQISTGVAEGGARKDLSKAAVTAIALLLLAMTLSVVCAAYYRRKYRTAQQHAAMVRGVNQTNEFINPAYNLSRPSSSSSLPAAAMAAGAAVIGTRRVADIGASTYTSSSVSINAASGSSAHATVVSRAGAGAFDHDSGAGFGVGAGAGVAGAVRREEMLPQRHNQPNQEEVKGSSSPSAVIVRAAPPPYESTAAHQPYDGVSSGVANDADDDDGEVSSTV